MQRHVSAVVDSVNELAELGIVTNASAQVRTYPAVPLFKLYILNGEQTFFGYYPIRDHAVQLDGEVVGIWDLMGKDASLFHYARDGDADSMGSQFVQQSLLWFDSIWTSVAKDYQP